MKAAKDALLIILGLFSFLAFATIVVFHIALVRGIILFIAWVIAPEEPIVETLKSWC